MIFKRMSPCKRQWYSYVLRKVAANLDCPQDVDILLTIAADLCIFEEGERVTGK